MTGLKKIILKGISFLPEPSYTCLRNTRLYDWMNENAPDKRVLNLGSGIGRFDSLLSPDIKMVNIDIDSSKPNIHLIGDAHTLPFKSQSFDIIYSIAVLEHVKKPWIVADEITRILRPGGFIVLELPFLNTIHDDHDYFRFTDKGIRSLFDSSRYEIVFEQVGSSGGSFLSVFLLEYSRQFMPIRLLDTLWSIIMRYPFSLCKYLDLFIFDKKRIRITANSFSFIGMKR